MSTTALKDEVISYLQERKHCFIAINGSNGKYKMALLKTKKGLSDILVVHVGTPYFIQLLTDKGKLNKDQELFRKKVQKAKGVHVTAKSLDEIKALGL